MSDPNVIAEIQLSHPELVLTPTMSAVPGMTVVLEYQVIAREGTYDLFFEVSGGDFDAFEAALADDSTVSDTAVIVEGGDFRVYRMRLTSPEWLVLPEAAKLGMRVLRAEGNETGWRITLEVPELDQLQSFREYCSEQEVGFSTERLYRADRESEGAFGLTPVQRETLVAAYRAGYFQEPQGASVEDLAESLGVSSSAVSGRLRRGIENLVEETLLE